MKKLKKVFLTTAITASLCSINISTASAADEIKPGRYSPVTSQYTRMFHNSDSFECDNSAAFCKNIESSKFTPEENELIAGSPVFADLTILKDKSTGDYSVSGRVFVGGCEIATGIMYRNINVWEYADDAVKCEKNDNGSITCPFFEPSNYTPGLGDEPDIVRDTHAIFTISQNSPKTIAIAAKVTPEGKQHFNNGCIKTLDGSIFDYETDKEYIHNIYLSAKLVFLQVDTDLNMKWKSLSKAQRDKLLPAQKKWIKKKDDKCGAVTMKGTEEKLTKMYACQTEMTQARTATIGK